MAYAQNRSQSVPTYIVIYLFTTYARTYTHTHTYTYHPLSPSSWLRDRRIKWCERPCACIDLNWVSPRVQSHLISLYDYVIKTVSLSDRSRPVKKGAATRRRLGEQVAVSMHTMGTSFVGKVRDVRQIAEAQIGEGLADMVEFEAQVNGHEATEKANRIQAWQGLLDWQLADRFDRKRPVLLLPGSLWSCHH